MEDELLLASPAWQAMEEYYSRLTASSGLCIKQTATMGKGVIADRDFDIDQVILIEAPLVASQHSHNKNEALVCSFCFRYIGSIRLQIQRKLEGLDSPSCCGGEHHVSPSKPLLELVRRDDLCLPYQGEFALSSVVSCPRGCSEVYCSVSCVEQAWEAHHSLLCSGVDRKKEELALFKHFADETNDIFHLASQVIANVMIRAKRLSKERGHCSTDMSILMEAWEPFSMGQKRLWWEAVALPDDVAPEEEASFRNQMKELASDSLCLLKAALCDEEFAPLFSLNVYGSIIGMFELNNLDVVVESPVENYFLFIEDLEPHLKEQAQLVTGPILDALGDRYASFCQGSGFFALQSCINHSCQPNAKAFKRAEDTNGNAVIIAARKIAKGEEVFASYIDEDLSYLERQAMLADYGFVCQCLRCRQEKCSSS